VHENLPASQSSKQHHWNTETESTKDHALDSMTSVLSTGGSPPPLERNGSSTATYASYVPHDLKYSATFEDALVDAVLSADSQSEGIRIIPYDSDEQPVEGDSVRAEDVDFAALPHITEEELPLPLDDARRVYASPVPGVRLTHPGGYLEGGPGLDPEMDTFPDDFFTNTHPSISTTAQLDEAVKSEVASSVALLKQRMEARRQGREKNERIEKELRTLMDQHQMELRLQDRMANERRKKKEAREKKREGKAGG